MFREFAPAWPAEIASEVGFTQKVSAFTPTELALLRYYQRSAGAIASNDDGTGTVAPDGVVGWWQDLSGNGEHAKQATAGDKPLYRAAHSIMGDSIEAVNSDLLKWTTALTMQDFTLFFDVSFDALGAGVNNLLGSSASDNNLIGVSGSGGTLSINAAGNNYNITGLSLSANTRYIIMVIRSGTGSNNITAYVNNVSVGTSSGNAQLTAIDQLFARGNKTSVFDGACKAAGVKDAALSAAQRTSLYTFLAAQT